MPTPSNLYIATVPDMLHNCHQPKIVGVAMGMLSPTNPDKLSDVCNVIMYILCFDLLDASTATSVSWRTSCVAACFFKSCLIVIAIQQATSASPCIPYKFRDIEKINMMNLPNRDQSGLKPSQAGHQLHSQPSHAPQWRISDGPTKMKEHFYWLVENKPTSGIHLAFHIIIGVAYPQL